MFPGVTHIGPHSIYSFTEKEILKAIDTMKLPLLSPHMHPNREMTLLRSMLLCSCHSHPITRDLTDSFQTMK